MATTAYCVKCKEKREMAEEKEVEMKGRRMAMEGKCPVCGTKMFRILGKKKD
jgi:DNA polymerase II large subunit